MEQDDDLNTEMCPCKKEMILFDELESILRRYTEEYSFTFAQVLGVMELLKEHLMTDFKEQMEECDEENEE